MNIIDKIEREQMKPNMDSFNVGDTVRVHTRVVEGDKERIQVFIGIVIEKHGSGINQAFTVRRVAYGEGVERVFPIHSPRIAKIEVERRGDVRRAALYYLRHRKGKAATTVKEKVDITRQSRKSRARKAKAQAPADPTATAKPAAPEQKPEV